jgi:hypothetical protein
VPGTVIPAIPPQYFDNNGDPAAGYKLFTYSAGTTTKLATYTDADLTVANANPIVLDSAGRATIFLSANTYKFVLATPTDTDPPASPVWTRDNVAATAAFNVNIDITGIAGEAIGAAEVCFMADGTGGLVAGRWYRADADSYWMSTTAPVLGFPVANITAAGNTGNIRIAGRVANLGPLTTGARYNVSTAAGQLTTSKLPNHRLVGQADSTTSLILMPAANQFRQLIVEFGIKGGAALTTGVHKYMYINQPFLILGWTLIADQSGSMVIDVWSDTYANAPPTVADTIAGSEKPTLSAAQKNQDLSLSSWTFLVPGGNVLGFNVDSAATCTFATLTLDIMMV